MFELLNFVSMMLDNWIPLFCFHIAHIVISIIIICLEVPEINVFVIILADCALVVIASVLAAVDLFSSISLLYFIREYTYLFAILRSIF